ncbi:MAG: hypothetical protein IJ604_00005 [Prevotella sp.]|nr:hypothetical protein [Prevotella sp.]
MEKIKTFFKGLWKGIRFLFLTPSWGSKRRQAQQEYERDLEEGRLPEVERQNLERRERLKKEKSR